MPGPDPRRPLLFAGVGLLIVGGLLLAGSLVVPALRDFVPWFALAGTLAVLLYFIVRRAATAPELDRRDKTLFPHSTMLDDGVDRDTRRD